MNTIAIKNKKMSIPVVQGGMGVGISLGRLAGTVAFFGGMGTISFVNIGYREPDFLKNPIEANKRAFLKEIEIARKKSEDKGIILVNIMNVVNHLEEYLEFINGTDIDGVVIGAGLPMEMPKYIDESKIIAPIVSSSRALKFIAKRWWKNEKRLPDFIVLEGPKAGGHLGFKKENLDVDILDELQEVIKVKSDFEKNHIPVFVGGGFGKRENFKKALERGADGVQIGTRFLFTEESNLDVEAKKRLLKNKRKYPVEILISPVGMNARGIRNEFIEEVRRHRIASTHCINCISTCTPSTTPYCISDALINAVRGNFESGLYFSGTDIEDIDEIVRVEEYLKTLLGSEFHG